MRDISEIDRNFSIKSNIEGVDLVSYDVRNAPFNIYGLIEAEEGVPFHRLPDDVAKATSEGVAYLHTNTAGGRVRFSTDSRHISIHADMPGKCLMPHMAFSGSSGFDIYINENGKSSHACTYVPPVDRTDFYETLTTLPDNSMRNFTINFPLYDCVDRLLVGIDENAVLKEAVGYTHEKPIIFYGSSITQGGCASRPGNSYQAMISRRFDCDFHNFGFSGNAKGKPAIADYIATQEMSLFFLDYDHNAPSAEFLEQTHEKFFMTIREKNPDLPIIISSKTDLPCNPYQKDDIKLRSAVIRKTYENSLKRGDKNVYFINGGDVFSAVEYLGISADSCTVDGCHPNDLGFAAMAKVFGDKIQQVLGW